MQFNACIRSALDGIINYKSLRHVYFSIEMLRATLINKPQKQMGTKIAFTTSLYGISEIPI